MYNVLYPNGQDFQADLGISYELLITFSKVCATSLHFPLNLLENLFRNYLLEQLGEGVCFFPLMNPYMNRSRPTLSNQISITGAWTLLYLLLREEIPTVNLICIKYRGFSLSLLPRTCKLQRPQVKAVLRHLKKQRLNPSPNWIPMTLSGSRLLATDIQVLHIRDWNSSPDVLFYQLTVLHDSVNHS